jgi:3-carboxy-cis,cis-muconate cycloisomerase
MALLNPLFGTEPVQGIFSDTVRLQRMLDFEAALAKAEAKVGVIPLSAVESIQSQCRADLFPLNTIAQATATAGNLAIPMVAQLTALVAAADEDAAGYIHWGATSQDAIDTGLILQLRDALDFLENGLARLGDILAALAKQHRNTPVVARTWMQHAIPTRFGLEVAGWLDALLRHQARLRETKKRALVLQFGGAAGTLAALGDRGLDVAQALADELNLALPDLPWHSHRDRIAEVATTLALCAGTLGKIARDIALQAQSEISELSEPAAEGRGGSSTMPHKRNPVSVAVALSAAIRVPALTSAMLGAMVQEHERGLGGWHAEWETLPEIVQLTAGSLHHMTDALEKLEIKPDRMLHNLEHTRGLVFSEAAVMALANHVGRDAARQIVDVASRRGGAEGAHLRTILTQDPAVTRHLSAAEIDAVFDSEAYTGVALEWIDRVLATHERLKRAMEHK